MKFHQFRLHDVGRATRLVKSALKQCLTLCGLITILSLAYLLGAQVGKLSRRNAFFVSEEWNARVAEDGFLDVDKILSDPRTTGNPMYSWMNKVALSHEGSASQSLPQAAGVVQNLALSAPPVGITKAKMTRDLYQDEWIRSAASACHSKVDPVVLVIVISAPINTAERQAIRHSWGMDAAKHSQTAIIYLVGISQDSSLMDSLLLESDLHADLAITANIDSYYNLTLKSIAAFRWMQTFCPEADFILKSDDDMFIQINRLRQLAQGLRSRKSSQSAWIMGNVATGWKPVRNKDSKYHISEEQYMDSTFPAFVTGPSYFLTRTAVNLLLEEALLQPFIHLEDVFLTGICAEKADIPRRLAMEFRNNAVEVPVQFLGCTLLRTISIHKITPMEQKKLYKMSKNPSCGKTNA